MSLLANSLTSQLRKPRAKLHLSQRLTVLVCVILSAFGLGYWGAQLAAPKAVLPGTVLTEDAPISQQDAAQRVTAWLQPIAPSGIKVEIIGLIAAGLNHSVAVLTVNGRAPQAFKVNQELIPGVRLAQVKPNGIVLDQQGSLLEIRSPSQKSLENSGVIVKGSSIAVDSIESMVENPELSSE